MPIDKIEVFADGAGAVIDEPTPTEKGLGWIEGEQVAAGHHNWWTQEITNQLNKIIAERLNSFYSEAVDYKKMIATGQWDESWGITNDSLNVITAVSASSRSFVAMCIHFGADGTPYLLVADNSDLTIKVYNARTRAHVVTTDPLTNDLPTAGSPVYSIESMCTDGTSVFLTFWETAASPDEHFIQGWTVDLTDPDWPVKSGWPTAGTQLSGTGTGIVATARQSNAIIADDNYIAVSCGYITAAATSSALVQLYSIATGALVRVGCGNCTLGSVYYATDGIASDGTHIYFSVGASASGAHKIASATIADLTTDPWSGTPLTVTSDVGWETSKLCALGVGNLVVSANVNTARANTDSVLLVHDAGTSLLDQVLLGVDTATVAGDFQYWSDYGAFAMKFDGVNLWVLTSIDNKTGDPQTVFIKIDVAKLSGVVTDSFKRIGDICSYFIVVPNDDLPYPGAAGTIKWCSMEFDGRDMWAIVAPASGSTTSGKIFRLPLALIRN